MPGDKLVRVFSSLCELDPPEVLGQGIEISADRDAFRALVEVGALVHVGNTESVICFGCDEPHPIAVEFAGNGGYRGYCADSGYQAIQPSHLMNYSVDEDWLVRALRSGLGIGRRGSREAPRSVAGPIGRARFAPYVCEFFFGRRLSERARFDDAKRTLAGLIGKIPAILLTTTPRDLIPGDPPPRCAIVAIDDVLQISVTDMSLDDGPIYAALRGRDHAFEGSGVGFVFSSGFRSGKVGDQEYNFTDKQALVIEALLEARHIGLPRSHQTEILGKANTSQRVGQLFAGHPAYGTLIKHDGKGNYWLDL
jgi:hypothetical protein